MENKVVFQTQKKELLPDVVIDGHEFTLKISESDMMEYFAEILAASGKTIQDMSAWQDIDVDAADVPVETVKNMITTGKTAVDTRTGGKRLIERMFGKGAYKKITAGQFYTCDDDLELAGQIIVAIREGIAEKRREKNTLESSKKAK